MSRRADPNVPSPVLPGGELRQVLIDHLLSGFASLWGWFSSLVGERRDLPMMRSREAEDALEAVFDDILAADRPGVPEEMEDRLTIGIVGTGPGGGHPAVVQVIWHQDHVEAAAHALKGPGMEGSPPQALDVVERALDIHRSG